MNCLLMVTLRPNDSECARAQGIFLTYPIESLVNGVAPKYAVKWSLPVVTSIIRKMTNWQEKDSWNIPAVYFADEKALVFDLNAAYAPTKKGGWSARRESEAAAAEAALNMTVEE